MVFSCFALQFQLQGWEGLSLHSSSFITGKCHQAWSKKQQQICNLATTWIYNLISLLLSISQVLSSVCLSPKHSRLISLGRVPQILFVTLACSFAAPARARHASPRFDVEGGGERASVLAVARGGLRWVRCGFNQRTRSRLLQFHVWMVSALGFPSFDAFGLNRIFISRAFGVFDKRWPQSPVSCSPVGAYFWAI